jgi:DNA-binding SARP family transcriptional activator/predicted ATPase
VPIEESPSSSYNLHNYRVAPNLFGRGTMAHLSLSLLGPFQITLDGQPVTGFKSNKVRALLAYLAMEAHQPHPREVLAGLLWPDWPDRDALGNLRYALSNLRRVIGDRTAEPPFLLITRDTLQFNTASDHSLDVRAFTELTEPALSAPKGSAKVSGLEEATALYRGGFMEGFSLPDAAPFEEWALLTRERLARQMSSTLQRLSDAHETRQEYEKAQSYARRQLELDPWDEAAHQRLMRNLALGGKRSAALAQYEACRRLLADELDVEPAPETTRLYQQISDAKLAAALPSAPAHEVAAAPPPFLGGEPREVERPIFVARERELAQLDGFLDLALTGQGRVAFVTGEAGSGKTALLQEFVRRAQAAHPDLVVATGNCNAHTGVGDPYLPFREILGLLTGDVEARWAAGAITRDHALRLWSTLPLTAQALADTGPDLIGTLLPGAALVERARAHDPGATEWLARLDELVGGKIGGPGIPGPQQSDLLEQYARVLNAVARRVPLVLVMDDLQWADLGSISLLFHMGRQLAGSRTLMVGAYRPEQMTIGRDGERHPLEPVVNEFQRLFGDIAVDMDRAERHGFVEAFLDREPNSLTRGFREMLYRRTLGHPLFTVELLRGMQERGDLIQDSEGRWVEGPSLDWKTLPARVEAAIEERIGRLGQPHRAALRVASVEGEDFTAEVVARVEGTDEREMVRLLSSELDRRQRLVRALSIQRVGPRRLSHYQFRHDLYQKYLYDNLDQVERAYLHEDVGNVLEELHGERTSEIALQLARHFEEAGLTEKAINYLHQAGERAVELSAYEEGIAHLTGGLSLLATLPESPERAEQELALQLTLGLALQGTKGPQTPRAKETFSRARELSQGMGKTTQLCKVLGDLAVHYYVRAEHSRAREFGEQALSLAKQAKDPLLEALGHWYLGFLSFGLGEYVAARAQLDSTISFYEPHRDHHQLVSVRGSDPGPGALAYTACSLWCLGYPERALSRSREALTLAHQLDHPFTLADVLCFAGCVFDEMRRDAQAMKDHAEGLVGLSKGKGILGWLAAGTCFLGESRAMLGELQEGIAQMQEGLAMKQSHGIRLMVAGTLCSLAEAYAKAGRPDEGLTTLAEALTIVDETDERHYEAELHRIRGELLLVQGSDAEAEASLRKAIEVARHQQAKSWELRATTSLCRLLKDQGKMQEAQALLAEVYSWFTEGFDTPDLREAQALLQELA